MAVVIKSRKETDIFAPLSGEFFSNYISRLSGDHLTPWRKASFARALTAPIPENRNEDFKYVNFRLLDFTELTPAHLSAFGNDNGNSSQMTIAADQAIRIPDRYLIEATKDASSDGVFFGSFDRAATALPQELTSNLEFFTTSFPRRKFPLLAHSFLNQGTFFHVGKSLELQQPRHIYTSLNGSKQMTSSAALVVVEDNSKANLFWDIDSDSAASGFANSTVDVILKSGSKLSLLVNQEYSAALNSVMTVRVYLEKDSQVEIVSLNTGGRLNQMEIDLQFAGSGSRALVNGVYVGRNEENFNLLTHQDHRVGHTNSDLFYIGTLSGKSKSNYLGKITIAPNAQRSDAYQKNRNLVLNKGVSVNSSPKLEICANDVRCTHGATTARISDLEMFYLRSRGIDKRTAKVMLSEGFLSQVTDRLQQPILHKAYEQRLSSLLTNWGTSGETE